MPISLRSCRLMLLSTISVLVSACGQPQGTAVPGGPSEGSRALLPLEKISAAPQLPADAPSPSEPLPEAVRYMQTARDRFDQQLWSDALSQLEKAIKLDPQFADAHLLLARAALRLGDTSRAQSHLDEATRLSPRDPAVHQLLGEIAVQARQMDTAVAEFRLALLVSERSPQSPPRVLALLSLGLALKDQGYTRAAADQLDAYLSAINSPTDEMKRYPELKEVMGLYRGKAPALVGDLRTETGHYDLAAKAYRQAVAESPDDKALQKLLILSLARSKQTDQALQLVQKVVADNPGDFGALALLKEVCDLTGRSDRYVAELVRLAEAASDNATRLKIVEMLPPREHPAEAEKILKLVVAQDPENIDAAFALAELSIERKNFDETVIQLAKILQSTPEKYFRAYEIVTGHSKERNPAPEIRRACENRPLDGPVLFLLASTQLNPGDYLQAESTAEKALAAEPPFAPAGVLLAMSFAEQRKWDAALAALDDVVQAGMDDATIQLLRGTVLDALGRYEESEKALLESFKLDRKSPAPLLLLAQSIERRGELERAEKMYRRILDDVDPRLLRARERLVRLLLNSHKIEDAREYLGDFATLGQIGPAQRRCQVLLDLATSRQPRPEDRLNTYRSALEAILAEKPDADTHIDLAMSYEALSQNEEARAHAEEALKLAPRDLRVRERLATYLAKLLDFEKAAEIVADLLLDRPNDPGYQQRLYELAMSQADFDTAANLLQQLITSVENKNLAKRYSQELIRVYLLAKKYDEAVAAAASWLEEAPDDEVRVEVYLATLVQAKRFDDAIARARADLQKDPEKENLRRRLIEQLSEAKQYVEAQRQLLIWLAEAPDDYDLNSQLIRLCLQARDYDSAIEMAKTGLELPRHHNEYERLLGACYQVARRYDDAIEFYRTLAVGEEQPQAALFVIALLVEAERYREAEKEISHYLQPQLNRREDGEGQELNLVLRLRRYLATIYQLSDRPRQSWQQLEEVRALLPGEPGVNNDLGYSLVDAGVRLDEAEQMIRLAVGEEPLNGAYLDSMGWLLYKRERFPEALTYIRRGMTFLNRDDAVLHDHLGDTLYRLNQKKEAGESWEEARRILNDPDAQVTPPNPEDRRLAERLDDKLAQLAAGEDVQVAPTGEHGNNAAFAPASTQPVLP